MSGRDIGDRWREEGKERGREGEEKGEEGRERIHEIIKSQKLDRLRNNMA